MKLIEKLAKECWESRDDWSNHFDKALMQGFEAGFRKAREMATECCLKKLQPTDMAERFSFAYAQIISRLGEEEVE